MKSKIVGLIVLVSLLTFGFTYHPHSVQAIALQKGIYGQNESIIFATSGGPWVLYNTITGVAIGGLGSHTAGDDLGTFEIQNGNDYSVIETTEDGICENLGLDYLGCKGRPEFVGEFTFKVRDPNAPTSSGTSVTKYAYRPEVTIISPQKGGRLGKIGKIEYQVTDENDKNLRNDKDLGLGPTPVSIYYFDPADRDNRKLIARDLAAVGIYEWDTKDIEEGTYGLVVAAVDNSTERDEEIVEEFRIDKLAPVFKIKTDPAVSRGEDVKIIVDASEDLAEAPRVEVKQKGFRGFQIDLKGEKTHFEGTYTVIKGYDGPAAVFVSGKDVAGNEGSTIVSGGRFSVGVEPPPKPVVASPLDKDIVSAETITVTGNTREDTKAILLVNGVQSYEADPDEQGNFKFENIKVSAEFNNGVNFLAVTSRDQAGNVSESVSISVKFNLNPEISFVSPQKGSVLTGTVNIRVDAKDKNRDKLSFTYEASRDGGANWALLAENITSRVYSWNTTNLPNGEYLLRVTVDDGSAKVQVISEKFTLDNFVPIITFTDGDKAIVSKTQATISGVLTNPEVKEGRPKLTSLEHSLTEGKTWLPVPAADGVYDSFEEKFSLELTNLAEKKYTILFRSPGEKGTYGQATKTLIVDFGPPAVPEVLAPQASSILSDQDDTNPNLAGVQFTLSGNAEAGSIVSVLIDEVSFKGQASERGFFEVKNVTLRRHGQNQLRVFATDLAGNQSPETSLSLIYNNPPRLKFLNPRSGRGLNHQAEVRWEVQDPDLDQVEVVLSYRAGNQTFQRLVSNPPGASFTWDVSRLAEGRDYELKLEATDRVSSSQVIREFFIDNTPPRIIIEPLTQTSFRKSFTLEILGRAVENFSEIEFVEYSIDGEHWFKALITQGFLAKQASFKVRHPFALKDGEYEVSFRSLDSAGNFSSPAVQKFRIDTVPPRVGSFTLSRGILMLFPENEIFSIGQASPVNFKISLEEDTTEAFLNIENKKMQLQKDLATNLWQTEMVIDELGQIPILLTATDSLGNKIKKEIATLQIIPRGKTVADAKITVFVFDEEMRRARWQAESFGQENPVTASQNGEYELVLPAGRYELVIQKPGYERVKSSEFTLLEPAFINFDFELQKRTGIGGFFKDLIERTKS